MKLLKLITIVAVISLFSFWLFSIAKCEYLTWQHEKEFLLPKEVSSMINGKASKKVLTYSHSQARVYYVSSGNTSGDIITYVLIDGKWIFSGWKTSWSKTGSADDFVWHYFR